MSCCDYAHLPRDVACRKCGCRQSAARSTIQQWWKDEQLPWNWRCVHHPITVGTWRRTEEKGSTGKGKGERAGHEERKWEQLGKPPEATRPKAKAKPPSKQEDRVAEADDKNKEHDEEGWKQGGPSAKQRKKAKKDKDRRRKEEDEDMGGDEWSEEHEDNPPKTQPIVLPEVPRITLLRRLEARRVFF